MGYAFAPLEIINAMNKVRSPFNVNSLAQAGAIAALDADDHVKKSRKANKKGLEYFSSEFDKLGLKYVPSYGNFILTFPNKPAAEVDEELKKMGIIARRGGEKALRISVGSKEQNELCVKALAKILK
jgi:histidinol-phosphate aminotransferase